MLEKDEYGYVLKIVSNFPYHPWWRLTAQLVEGFRDKKRPVWFLPWEFTLPSSASDPSRTPK
jgi:hypothetical protein